jgi:hypothetical protein
MTGWRVGTCGRAGCVGVTLCAAGWPLFPPARADGRTQLASTTFTGQAVPVEPQSLLSRWAHSLIGGGKDEEESSGGPLLPASVMLKGRVWKRGGFRGGRKSWKLRFFVVAPGYVWRPGRSGVFWAGCPRHQCIVARECRCHVAEPGLG